MLSASYTTLENIKNQQINVFVLAWRQLTMANDHDKLKQMFFFFISMKGIIFCLTLYINYYLTLALRVCMP